MPAKAYLVRHGDTEWSKSGKHTGSTEVPLSPEGEERARLLAPHLIGIGFDLVLVSPRQRARRTCELAGLGASVQAEPDLAEWNYGEYEGLTSKEILRDRPDWCLFSDGCPGGESPGAVSARADRLIARIRSAEGRVALFSHGHFGRALGSRWMNLPVLEGRRLLLDPASLSILGYEHEAAMKPVLALWNYPPTGEPGA
ncbi:MAG TPA: histidine phosphatase family protein [Opitutaceae bacterium]|jgi:probable phosphoglycerate mutase|nr:histidine phosphatase family protein [Opitutaceae bacterium]